jgi:hypothetical protein
LGHVPRELARVGVIVRWEIEPLRRSRRGVDERLLLAAPWLLRPLFSLVVRARSGSRVRRAVLSRALRVGVAANNRGDYRTMSVFMSPEVELHLYPDEPELRPVDLEPVYHGREGYAKAAEDWKAGFGEHRWELREVVDPGGNQFGSRVEMVGRGGASGLETSLTQFHVWQVERGLLRRQWGVSSEAAMLALFEGAQSLGTKPAAQDPAE